jgi:hypothetical protein
MAEQDRDYDEGLDALQADMANHQRRFAGDVTAAANQKLAVETIQRLEKQNAEPQAPALPAPAPVPDREVQTHDVDGKTYTLDKAPDRPMFRPPSSSIKCSGTRSLASRC